MEIASKVVNGADHDYTELDQALNVWHIFSFVICHVHLKECAGKCENCTGVCKKEHCFFFQTVA